MTTKKRPSLSDIAVMVGVTKMTISRYLKDPSSVSDKTRKKIEKAINDTGYVPSRIPDIFSNRNSKAIGILIPSLSNQVFSSLCHGIESVTKSYGYQTLIAHYGYSAKEEENKIRSLLSYHVDGLILTESEHTSVTRKRIRALNIPVVETMDLPDKPLDMVVGLDHYQAAYELIMTMIRRSRRHIVYLGARLDRRTRLRLEGYTQAMLDSGLIPHSVLTEEHSSFSLGHELMIKTLQQIPYVDGIFCTNDDVAIGAMMYCQSHNIALPEQIAIAGYNGLDIGKAIRPRLASVDTQRTEIGRLAAELLIKRLSGEKLENKQINVGYKLLLEESLG